MIELGIDQYLGLDDIKGNKKGLGHKPMMLFQGDEFEHDESLKTLKSLLIDIFRGQETDSIHVAGLDSALVCSAHKGKVHLRWYVVLMFVMFVMFEREAREYHSSHPLLQRTHSQ